MTDDNNARYRSSDPFGPSPGASEHGNDPLAELARLIGQSDPFQQSNREPRPAEHEGYRYDDPPPYAEHTADRAAYDPQQDAPFTHEPSFAREPVERPEPEWQLPREPSFDPFPAAARQAQLDPAEDSRFQQPLPLPPSQPPRAFALDLGLPAAQPQQSSFDEPRFDSAPRPLPGFPRMMSASDPGPMPPPNPDEFYDDPPSGGRRKGMVTVMAVLCLAVLGTGAAFGYRTWFGGPNVKSAPPVIRASAEPSKVAPPPQADLKDTNKITYDRFADRGQNEQVVVREEKPVDVKDVTRSGPPRPVAVSTANAAGALQAAPPAANPPSVLTEPKRVRTVPIRPDTPDTSAARPQMVAPVPQRQAAVSANAPLDLANPVAPPQARASAPPPVRAAARPEPPPGTSPLSLAPESNPPAARSAPARTASVSASGNFLVQVSSQRSEADAQAAFRSVKSKYSGVLGDMQPVIRRAELAGKGTYYRAMVGPFTTRGEAVQLCSSLKAAGGDCVVQSN